MFLKVTDAVRAERRYLIQRIEVIQIPLGVHKACKEWKGWQESELCHLILGKHWRGVRDSRVLDLSGSCVSLCL